MLKWEVLRIYCAHLPNPHDKFCVCICPENNWFMFINSEPPRFRKSKELAVALAAHEALFLDHVSYVDTTALQTDIPLEFIEAALADPDRNHGALAPFVRTRIIEGVGYHNVMEPPHRSKVLEG